MKLRSHLITLVAVAVLPVLIFAVVVVVIFSREMDSHLEGGLVNTARALSLAVDRELSASIRVLEGLATSERLDRKDLVGFYDEATRVLSGQKSWQTIALLTPSGEQLLNLRRPFGSPLPHSPISDLVKRVAETGRPGVSDLFVGPIAGIPILAVQVPVARDATVRYVLGAVIHPETLVKLLLEQQIPPQWRAAILDRRKIIIARSTGDMVGQAAGPRMSAKSAESLEGFFRGLTRDGIPAYTGFHRSALSGWTTVIGAPVAEVGAPLRRSLWTIAGGGLLLLLGGTALAVIVGRRIARPIRALSASATALAAANPPAPRVASPVAEVEQVARALEEAGALLQRETDKREWVQAALRETNKDLDALIHASPAAIFALDCEGKVTKWNPAAERILGWSETEVLGRPFPPAQGNAADKLEALLERGLEGEALVNVETVRRTKHGAPVHLSVSLASLRDPAGRIAGVMAVATDITERKRAEWTARALARIGRELVETLDLAKVTDRIVATVFQRFRATRVNLYRRDPRCGGLMCVATAGETGPGAWLGRALLPGESHTALAIEEGRSMRSSDVLADPRFREAGWVRQRLLDEGCGPVAVIPLAARGQVLGALALAYPRGQTPAPGDFRLLTAFADHAAVALENARLYQTAEEHAQRLTRLSLLTRLITGAESGQGVFNAIAEAAVGLLGARVARVWVADPEAQVLRALGRCGIDPEGERRLLDTSVLPYGGGIPGRIFLAGQPEFIADSHDDPRWVNARFIKELDLHGYAGLPLIAGGRVLGVLSILFGEPKTFTDEDKELMSLLAGHGAIGISNARLYEDVEHRRREAEALAELASDINASLDLPTILQRVGEKAREMCGADLAWIALREPGSDSMRMRYSPGTRQAYDNVSIEPGKGIGGQVLLTGRPFRTDNYASDPRITKDYVNVAIAEEVMTAMVVPISGERGIEGLLYAENRSPRPFTDQDEAMLTRLASQAAVVINNAQLHEHEQQARAAAEASRELLRRVSAQLVDAQEAERRRIARELHDEIGQLLTGLKLTLETSARLGVDGGPSGLEEAQAQINELMVRVREMSLDLRPTMLDDLGLIPALLWHFDCYTAQTKIRVVFKHAGVEGRRFAPTLETAAYRIVQESLTNAARHSGEASVTARVWADATTLGVQVEDRGAGFDPAAASRGAGVAGMRERAASLGGELTIESSPGVGTRVTSMFPLVAG
jgi:PAS domain S-box-containing protein